MMELSRQESFMMDRKRKKIKLKDVAAYVGCSIGMLSLHERDMANMSQDKIDRYERYIMNS